MFSALFREYIVVFLEKQWKGNRFMFINRFLDLGGLYRGFLFLWFMYCGNIIYVGKGVFLD